MRRRSTTGCSFGTPGVRGARGRALRAFALLPPIAALLGAGLLELPSGASAQQIAAARLTVTPTTLPASPPAPRTLRFPANAGMPQDRLPPCCQADSGAREPVSGARMVVGGIGLGLAGAIVGGLIGSAFDDHGNCAGEVCDATGAFVGVGVGEVIAVPLGVHLANHRRGSLLYDYAASTVAMLAVSLVFAPAAGRSDTMAMVGSLALPVVQIAASVWAERRRTR